MKIMSGKPERCNIGLEDWKPRGKDRQKRKTEGYTERWVKWRAAKALENARKAEEIKEVRV